VSSLADAVTEEELRRIFSSHPASGSSGSSSSGEQSEEKQQQVRATPVVQFFTSTPRAPVSGNAAAASASAAAKPLTSKQAFVRFESVAAAVEALIQFHNVNLSGRYLRISFSGQSRSPYCGLLKQQLVRSLASACYSLLVQAKILRRCMTRCTAPRCTLHTLNSSSSLSSSPLPHRCSLSLLATPVLCRRMRARLPHRTVLLWQPPPRQPRPALRRRDRLHSMSKLHCAPAPSRTIKHCHVVSFAFLF
jgi:hypothetical protein